jgi:Domain of unknown function (DUF4203)
MLPSAYSVPVAVLLIAGGMIACFAGYRLLRTVMGIYGFIIGAMLASSVMGITNTVGMVAAAVLGGFVGAVVLVFAYFIGVALVGAGLGALSAHVVWALMRPGDPPAVAVIVAATVGAVGAMLLQRYVIIVTTALAGAWTILVGGLTIAAARGVEGVTPPGEPWILYPFTPAQERWVLVAWLSLGLIGAVVQLAIGGSRRKKR